MEVKEKCNACGEVIGSHMLRIEVKISATVETDNPNEELVKKINVILHASCYEDSIISNILDSKTPLKKYV